MDKKAFHRKYSAAVVNSTKRVLDIIRLGESSGYTPALQQELKRRMETPEVSPALNDLLDMAGIR